MRRMEALHLMIIALICGTMVGVTPEARAQTCNRIQGSFFVADGSTPPDGQGVINARPTGNPDPDNCTSFVCSTTYVGWGEVEAQVFYESTEGYELRGGAAGYFTTPWSGSVPCLIQPPGSGCIQCSGSFNIGLYGSSGSFNGTVYRLPEGGPQPNAFVMAVPYTPGYNTTADGAGCAAPR